MGPTDCPTWWMQKDPKQGKLYFQVGLSGKQTLRWRVAAVCLWECALGVGTCGRRLDRGGSGLYCKPRDDLSWSSTGSPRVGWAFRALPTEVRELGLLCSHVVTYPVQAVLEVFFSQSILQRGLAAEGHGSIPRSWGDKSCIPEGGSGLCSTAWFPNSRSYIKIPEVGAPGIPMCPELVEYHHHQPDPAILYMPFQLWASIEEGCGMSSRRVCKSRKGFILSQEIVLCLHRQKIESRSSCSENILLLRKKEEIFYFSRFFYSCDVDSRTGRYAILWALSYLQLIFMNGQWEPGAQEDVFWELLFSRKTCNPKIPSEISDRPLRDLTCLLFACFSDSKTAVTFFAQMFPCCNRIAKTTNEKKNHHSPRHFRVPALNCWMKVRRRGDSGGGAFPGGERWLRRVVRTVVSLRVSSKWKILEGGK